jgi:hypothetical protein
MRWVLHVDMDAFYASVEQRDHPQLRGQPVAVGGGGDRGVVMTASYEARAFGVGSAMPTSDRAAPLPAADRRPAPLRGLPGGVAGRPRPSSTGVTDLVEPLSLDEAYLDVSHPIGWPDGSPGEPPPPQDADEAAALATAVLRAIRAEVGLGASAGVASGKFLAKVASATHKPAGLTVVRPEEADAFLAALPIERFFGVGPKTAARLRAAGVASGADLRARTPTSCTPCSASWATSCTGSHAATTHDRWSPTAPASRSAPSAPSRATCAAPTNWRPNWRRPARSWAVVSCERRPRRAHGERQGEVRRLPDRDARQHAREPGRRRRRAVAGGRAAGVRHARPAGAVRLIGVAASGLIDRRATGSCSPSSSTTPSGPRAGSRGRPGRPAR